MTGYALYLGTMTLSLLTYVFAAQIIARFTQVWPFCIPALGGISGYTTAILSTVYGWPPAVALTCGVALAAIIGAASGILVSRLSPDRASVATLALQIGWIGVFRNGASLTNGALGIANVPSLGNASSPNTRALFALLLLAPVAIVWIISRRRAGGTILAWLETAHFEAPRFLSGAGWPVATSRTLAWTLASTLAGLSGGLWTQTLSFIDPSTFSASNALLIVCVALLSGQSAIAATVVSVAFVAFPELLRTFGISSSVDAALQQTLFGLFVVAAVASSIYRARLNDSR